MRASLLPTVDFENFDQARAESIAASQPPVLSQIPGTPQIEIDNSSKTTRIGLAASRLVRGAGAVSLVIGSYGVVSNALEINAAPDKIVRDVSDMDNGPLDEVTSRVLDGRSTDPTDGETVLTGFGNIMQTIYGGVDVLIDDAQSAGEGIQDMAVGGVLAATGQAGTSLFKRRRKRDLSYLQVGETSANELFVTPLLPHVSRTGVADTSRVVTLRQHNERGNLLHRTARLYERAYYPLMGALLLSGIGVGANIARAADDTITKPLDGPLLSEAQDWVVEHASGNFEESMTRDLGAAVEKELPKTMKVVQNNPNAEKIYRASVDNTRKEQAERAEDISGIGVEPTFFERMRNRFENASNNIGLGLVLSAVAGGVFSLRKLRPYKFGTGKARVSKNFLHKSMYMYSSANNPQDQADARVAINW